MQRIDYMDFFLRVAFLYKTHRHIYIYIYKNYLPKRLSGGTTCAGDQHNLGKSTVQPIREREREIKIEIEREGELSRPVVR